MSVQLRMGVCKRNYKNSFNFFLKNWSYFSRANPLLGFNKNSSEGLFFWEKKNPPREQEKIV